MGSLSRASSTQSINLLPDFVDEINDDDDNSENDEHKNHSQKVVQNEKENTTLTADEKRNNKKSSRPVVLKPSAKQSQIDLNKSNLLFSSMKKNHKNSNIS